LTGPALADHNPTRMAGRPTSEGSTNPGAAPDPGRANADPKRRKAQAAPGGSRRAGPRPVDRGRRPGGSDGAPAASDGAAGSGGEGVLWPSEVAVSEGIGRLMAFWGFKRNMGRIWAILYLSEGPLSARDLRARLGLSSGSVSMTLNELQRWGVVKKVWVRGERRDYFAAEGNLWKMIRRVLAERERSEIVEVIATLEEALAYVDRKARFGTPEERARAAVQRNRIGQLLELAKVGRSLLDALVSTARVDASPLVRFLLGSRA